MKKRIENVTVLCSSLLFYRQEKIVRLNVLVNLDQRYTKIKTASTNYESGH